MADNTTAGTDREAEIVLAEAARLQAARDAARTEREARSAQKLVVVIPEDAEYVDRSLQTASWYDVHIIQAGTYPVEFPSHYNYRDAVCKVNTVLTKEYRVNRLFSHSQVQETTPNRAETKELRWYSYEPAVGKPVYSAGKIIGHFADAEATA